MYKTQIRELFIEKFHLRISYVLGSYGDNTQTIEFEINCHLQFALTSTHDCFKTIAIENSSLLHKKEQF